MSPTSHLAARLLRRASYDRLGNPRQGARFVTVDELREAGVPEPAAAVAELRAAGAEITREYEHGIGWAYTLVHGGIPELPTSLPTAAPFDPATMIF